MIQVCSNLQPRMTTKINLYATMRAVPGKRETLVKLLSELAEQVRNEPGNVRFVVYTRKNDPDFFHVEETYNDQKAFEEHMESPHGKAFNKAIKDQKVVEGGESEVVFLEDVSA